jgi:hypothetical protein
VVVVVVGGWMSGVGGWMPDGVQAGGCRGGLAKRAIRWNIEEFKVFFPARRTRPKILSVSTRVTAA